jgi:hypothetical protein
MEFKEYKYEVTKDWLLSNKTANDSWNAKQLACLCIDWPPRKGWINRAVGTKILVSQKERFERLAGEPVKEKLSVQDLHRRVVELERQIDSMRAFLV